MYMYMYMWMMHRVSRSRRWYSSAVFQWGEYVLAEDKKGRQRLFQLQEGSVFHASSGCLKHDEIIGQSPCQRFTTHIGSSVWFRRPRLDEYVCLMQRSATPTYPKDIWAMMGYLNIGGGATVIEAGTGSGGMTLYLSSHGMPCMLLGGRP
jgi:tRNA (adenine57-N1/adenine58-N1)-methyltransferase